MPGIAPLAADLRAVFPHIPFGEEGREVIASPASTEEVSALLRHCDQNQLPIEIAGAGTKRTWGGTAEAALILNSTRLSGVREHPWQDLTATVGAGTPWAEMQRVLIAHNQFVALDPLWPERATVGGVLATNDSGALRLKYGSARDLVIGMTLVLADGTIARTGGKVVKNVAGYDLHKLMIGAFGTLAVITEVTFRLHPLPQYRAAWTFTSPEIESIAKLAKAIASSHLNPEAVQMRTSEGRFALDVLLAAAPEVLRKKGEAVIALANSQEVVASSFEEAHLLAAREQLRSSAAPILKATMLPTAVPSMLARIAAAEGTAVAYPLGIVYAACDPGCLGVPGDGSLTVLGGPAPAPMLIMREIKRQFDPNRVLNRGLMGGL